MAKLKDLVKENFSVLGGVVSTPPINTNDTSLSGIVEDIYGKEEKISAKEVHEAIKEFSSFGKVLQKEIDLKNIAERLSTIANNAKSYTLSETDDWFDKVTVNRNMKELTNLSKSFGKIAQESHGLQQRMSGLYEDMGHILGRYYQIGERHVPGHDDDDRDMRDDIGEADNMMFREDDDYKAFFKKAMKKFNVTSVEDMSDEDKKDFFNYVDRNYKAKNEIKQ